MFSLKIKKNIFFLFILSSKLLSNIECIDRSGTRPENEKCLYLETACLYGEVIMHYFARNLQRLIYIRLYENCNVGVVI
jgi:hypothetical protein